MKKSALRLLMVTGWVLCSTLLLQAQKEGAVWYFGQYAGLDFNRYYPSPLTDGQINTREGVASISTEEGELLFYTDGTTIWNKNHQVMMGGEGLMGNTSSTQSSIVVPKPGDALKKSYYIFTVDKVGENGLPGQGIHYTLVDMSKNFGLGEVVTKNTLLFEPATEKITAVKHFDNESYWIIGHALNSNTFKVYLLNRTSVIPQPDQHIGLSHDVNLNDRNDRGAVGYMKSSPKGDYLAVAHESRKLFELFQFDNRLGTISNPVTLYAGTPAEPRRGLYGAYGLEFSPTSNYFYGSTRQGGGVIYRWDLTAGNETSIQNSIEILQEKLPNFTLCGAMQMAFNGKIYVTFSGESYLGVINAPTQEECNYQQYGTNLLDNETGSGGRAYFGLPTFLPDFFQDARFYFENTCQYDKTIFYLSTIALLEVPPKWNIYDSVGTQFIGSVEVDLATWTGQYTFTEAGTYIVELEIKKDGEIQKQKRELTIHPIPNTNFGDTTIMCGDHEAILDAGYGAFYEWRDNPNLSLTRYRSVNQERWYHVRLIHYNGCWAVDSTYVEKKPLPQATYEVVAASCGNDNGQITVRVPDDPALYDFTWEDDPEFTGFLRGGLKAGIYPVDVISKETGCSIRLNVAVSEIGAPDVIIEASDDQTVCPGTEITLTAAGATIYEWQHLPGQDLSTIMVAPWEDTEYIVKGTTTGADGKQCSGFATHSVDVFTYTMPDLGGNKEECEGGEIRLDGGSEFVVWEWSTGDEEREIVLTTFEDEWLTDVNGCRLSDSIQVEFKPVPVVELGEDRAICKGTEFVLDAGAADRYSWNTGDTVRFVNVTETSIYEVEVSTRGCSAKDKIRIQVNDPEKLVVDSVMSRDLTCFGHNDGEILIYARGEGTWYKYSVDDGDTWFENQGHFQSMPAGSYRIVIEEDSACVREYPEEVVIVEPDSIALTYKQISPSCDVCNDGEILLDIAGGTAPYAILWANMQTSRRLTNLPLGEYPVWVTDAKGCRSYAILELELGHMTYSIPNAFTPNGDGINETWLIAVLDNKPEALVQVYDRTGRLLFESQGPYTAWDGRDLEGNPLPMGSYFYLIRVNPGDRPVTGTVTIIR